MVKMFRAYRREVIDALELEADRKEIDLEILSKALCGWIFGSRNSGNAEMASRRQLHISTKATSISHFLFSFYEKPSLLFGLIGIMLAVIGFFIGVYILLLWQQQTLNPVRPLMTLLLLFVLSGIQLASFGFIGTQIAALRKEIIKVERKTVSWNEPLWNTFNTTRTMKRNDNVRSIKLWQQKNFIAKKRISC